MYKIFGAFAFPPLTADELLFTPFDSYDSPPANDGMSAVSGADAIGVVSSEAAMPLLSVRPAVLTAAVASGSGSGQGDVAMHADVARSDNGVDGAGIKVGILSTSFNAMGGMQSDIAADYLPADTTILKDVSTGAMATDEGRAMAQVVHDVAPGAAIAFYSALGGQDDFANGILALFNAGARVIVDDITYLNEPFFQSDAVAHAIDSVVSRGAVFFTSAGNEANNSYLSDFRPTTVVMPDGTEIANAHDFDPGAGVAGAQSVTIGAHSSATFVLQWAQPYGAAPTDMELRFYSGSTLLGAMDRDHSASGPDPIVGATVTTGASPVTLQIAVDDLSGPAPGLLKYVVYGNGVPVSIDSFGNPAGTVSGHHMDPNAITVGAAAFTQTPAFGVNPAQVEPYSSSGTVTLLFDDAGNPIPALPIDKVDVVAPDGVSTSVPGMTAFYGTSVSAPDAGAVAALLLQTNGGLTAQDIVNLLKASALDMASPGFDPQTGYGLIQADRAVAAAATLTIAGSGAADTVAGTHLDDVFLASAGDDVLSGGGGRDTFIQAAGDGSDVITDFIAGRGGDVIRLDGYGVDYAYVQAHTTAVMGASVVALPNGETMTLRGVDSAALDPTNFSFDGGQIGPPVGANDLLA